MMKKESHSLLLSGNIQILNALLNTDATLFIAYDEFQCFYLLLSSIT